MMDQERKRESLRNYKHASMSSQSRNTLIHNQRERDRERDTTYTVCLSFSSHVISAPYPWLDIAPGEWGERVGGEGGGRGVKGRGEGRK